MIDFFYLPIDFKNKVGTAAMALQGGSSRMQHCMACLAPAAKAGVLLPARHRATQPCTSKDPDSVLPGTAPPPTLAPLQCNVGYAFINMVRPEYIVPLVGVGGGLWCGWGVCGDGGGGVCVCVVVVVCVCVCGGGGGGTRRAVRSVPAWLGRHDAQQRLGWVNSQVLEGEALSMWLASAAHPQVEELHGKKWPKFNSEKICHIAYGRIQVRTAAAGLAAAAEQVRLTRLPAVALWCASCPQALPSWVRPGSSPPARLPPPPPVHPPPPAGQGSPGAALPELEPAARGQALPPHPVPLKRRPGWGGRGG